MSWLIILGSLALTAPASAYWPSPRPLRAPGAPRVVASQESSEERYAYIVGLFERGLYSELVREAEGFLRERERDPLADHVRYRLAEALFQDGHVAQAEVHFARIKDGDFEFRAERDYRLSQCDLAAGEARKAVRRLDKIERVPAYLGPSIRLLEAEARFELRDYAAADEAFAAAARMALERARGSDGDLEDKAAERAREIASESMAGRAWCALRAGKFDDALLRVAPFVSTTRGTDGFLRASTHRAEMHFVEGEALRALERHAQALAAYARVDSDDLLGAALRGRAFSFAGLERRVESAAAFARLVREHPDSAFLEEALLQHGVELLLADNPRRALEVLTDNRQARSAEVFLWRARAQLALGEGNRALEELAAARKVTGAQALEGDLDALRAEALFATGNLDESAEIFGNTSSDRGLYAASVAQFNAGRSAQALELALRHGKLFPEGDYARDVKGVMAEALFALERWQEASPLFAARVDDEELDSVSRLGACRRLAWCRHLSGEHMAAAELFSRFGAELPPGAERAEAGYMHARSLELGGEQRGAFEAFERWIGEHDGEQHSSEVLLALARLSDRGAGSPFLERIVEEFGSSEGAEKACIELAEAAARSGDAPRAAQFFATYIERFSDGPNRRSACYGLAYALFDQNDASGCLTALGSGGGEALTGSDDLALAALELEVFARRAVNDVDGGLRAYRALAAAGADPGRRLRVARIVAAHAQEAGRPADAATLFEVWLAEDGMRPPSALLVEASFAALLGGETERSAQLLIESASAPGADAVMIGEVSFLLGEELYEAQPSEALRFYSAALEAPAFRERALYKAGFSSFRASDFSAAASSFEQLAKEFPRGAFAGEALYLAGECLQRAGRGEAALVRFEQFLREHAKHESVPKALFRAGVLSSEYGEWQDAVRLLERLRARHPKFERLSEAEYWRGHALAESGAAQAARRALEQCVAHDAGVFGVRARIRIGRIDYAEQNYDDALGAFLKVAVLYPQSEEGAEATLLAGVVLEAQGRNEQATARYRELIQNHPESGFALTAKQRLSRIGQK